MFDFHMHSTVSFDGHDSAVSMLETAAAKGLKEICFTDHMDYDPKDSNHKLNFAVADYAREYNNLEIPGLTIRRGFEFGIVNIPNPAYTNAAHKNGVMSIACIYFDPAFRPGQTCADMLTEKDGEVYVVAKKLVEMAKETAK